MKNYLVAGVLALATEMTAQNAATVKHEGCVMASPDDAKVLLLAEEASCSVLTGKLAKPDLLGHVIVLGGIDTAATTTEPQSVKVQKIVSQGVACHRVCTLEPPGHRGLHKKEKPGSQGGTPGQ